MIWVSEKTYATVFRPDDKGKYVKASLSTGSKQKDGTYKNSNWPTRFLGGCLEHAKALENKDRIVVTKGAIENIWDKENKTNWLTLLIFEFKYSDGRPLGAVGFTEMDDEIGELPF